MSLPSSAMRPEVIDSKPAIMFRVVVLPEPLGPSRVMNSPARISRSIPSTAGVAAPGKRLVRPSTSMRAPDGASGTGPPEGGGQGEQRGGERDDHRGGGRDR